MSISPTGSNPTPFGFVGGSQYQTDADSGLMLLGHRYYDSSIGRFISKDPAQAGANWYSYNGNNPLGAVDPSGLDTDNVGTVTNGSKQPQYGEGDWDPSLVPRKREPGDTPTPGIGKQPPWVLVPRDDLHSKNGIPFYPIFDPNNHDPNADPIRGVFPVAPGKTVGGNGIDIDDGWDRNKKKWIKNPGAFTPAQKIGLVNWGLLAGIVLIAVMNGNGAWEPNGSFDPAPGKGSGETFPAMFGDPTLLK